MRGAYLIRVAAPLLILLVLLLAVFAWLLPHRERHTTIQPSRARARGTLTLVLGQPCWVTPSWSLLSPCGMAGLLWNGLVDSDSRSNFFPEIAAQIPTPANGGIKVVNGDEVITYRLKPDLRWSDGSAITAADFVAALLVGSAPEVGDFSAAPGNCPLRGVDATATGLLVTLRGIYPEAPEGCNIIPLPWEYLQRKYRIAVPAAFTAKFDAGAVAAAYAARDYQGSPLQRLLARLMNDPYASPADLFDGPFRIASWAQNGPDVLTANPFYTALPRDTRHLGPATIRLVPQAAGRPDFAPAALAGTLPPDADLVAIGAAINVRELPPLVRSHPPFRLDVQAFLSPEHLELNLASPALRDRRVRLALAYAIDKMAIIRAIYHLSPGDASAIALTSPLPRNARFSINGQLPLNLYDPAKARSLMAAAGYATSPAMPGRHLHLDFYTTTDTVRQQVDPMLQHLWRQVGIEVTLHFGNLGGAGGVFSSYGNGGILARGRYDIVELQYHPPRDAGMYYYQQFDPGQIPDRNHPDGANTQRIRDRTLFFLLDQAQHVLDDARRARLFAQFQRRMVDQAYWISLFDQPSASWVKPSFGNFAAYTTYGGWTSYFWNAYQWYVR